MYKVVSTLINWHMRPYLKDMSEKKREAERTMLGEELCEALDILHEADVNSRLIERAADKEEKEIEREV